MNKIKMIINMFLKKMNLKRYNVRLSFFSFFDEKCKFEHDIHIGRMSVLHSASIGAYTYVTTNCEVSDCEIGRFCSIAGGVKIGLGMHPTNFASTSPVFYSNKNRLGARWAKNIDVEESKRIIIKNDVWIGTNALILGGVTIENGAIVAAGAVVTKDVPPYAIVAGVPAKVIKYRFESDIIEKLINIRWWNTDTDKLREMAYSFSNVNEMLGRLYDK